MRSKNINRNKMVERQLLPPEGGSLLTRIKKRMATHKKKTEEKSNIDKMAKEKVKTDEVIKEKIAKNKTTKEMVKSKTIDEVAIDKKKIIIRKKPSKEYIDKIKRKAEERVYRIADGTEEEFPEDMDKVPKHEISKDERTERFNRLHNLAVQMTKQWKENK